MGRLFVQAFPDDEKEAFSCRECGTPIAHPDRLNWTGHMGDGLPAKNFLGPLINAVACSIVYEQTLSSGSYSLRSMYCRCCCLYLGWRYEVAEAHNKDREGTHMLLDECLALSPIVAGAEATAARSQESAPTPSRPSIRRRRQDERDAANVARTSSSTTPPLRTASAPFMTRRRRMT